MHANYTYIDARQTLLEEFVIRLCISWSEVQLISERLGQMTKCKLQRAKQILWCLLIRHFPLKKIALRQNTMTSRHLPSGQSLGIGCKESQESLWKMPSCFHVHVNSWFYYKKYHKGTEDTICRFSCRNYFVVYCVLPLQFEWVCRNSIVSHHYFFTQCILA